MRTAVPTVHRSNLPLRALCFFAALAFTAQAGTQPLPSAGVGQKASDAHQSTPLIAAAGSGNIETVKSILASGAPIDATDGNGRTALIAAAESRNAEVARALVAGHANLNLEARYIGSALNVAENNGDTELAAFLLSAGAHSTGKSVGDTVCVRSWGGEGYCGRVKSFTIRSMQIAVTRLVGCDGGCPARQECSAANPVGGVNGLKPGEDIAVPSWCLTDTAVKQ
jgi:hypothetical protein